MANAKFKAHPIVGKLAESGAVKLLGYFGGTVDGVVKVHPTLSDLSVCLQVREDDILHVEEVKDEEMPHGASAIWVKPNAVVQRTESRSSSVEARFLAGGISAMMRGGRATVGGILTDGVFEPDTLSGPQGCTYVGSGCSGSIWPCSIVVGPCLASNDMPCQYTKQYWCPGDIYTEKSCFTCAGYTCVAQCHSAGCPPTQGCPITQRTHCGCEVYSYLCAR
jgi:hypothetical protein